MLGHTTVADVKWLIIGFLVGGGIGYAQGSGAIDFLALLPI